MKKFFALALALCRQDIHERFAGSILGSVWVFIWPLAQLFIYMTIFGKLMSARPGMNSQVFSYGIYVASGLIAWTCFSNTLQRASRAFVEKRHIICKVQVDLRIFPAAICLEEMIPFAAGLVLLFIADLPTGWSPSPAWFGLLLIAIWCQQILAAGLGLFFACLSVFARDISELVGIALQMAFWFTPIVYVPSILPDWLREWLWINPMTGIVEVYQRCFVFGGSLLPNSLLYAALIAHLCLALGLFVFQSWQKDIRDVI